MTLTQALAHGHAVLLRVEVVAVASAAPVDEVHAFLLVHVEVPAGHGGATGARLRLQGAHLCEGDSVRSTYSRVNHKGNKATPAHLTCFFRLNTLQIDDKLVSSMKTQDD